MSELINTWPEAESVQIALLRQAPPWRKMEPLGELIATFKHLSLLGLRKRYPDASEQELQRCLADLLLGSELAAKAYGSLADLDDHLAHHRHAQGDRGP